MVFWFEAPCVEVRVCKVVCPPPSETVPLPLNLTTMVLLVLSVFGGVELGSEVVLLGVLLFVCWYHIKEGNGV